jgi:hypothetical protein
MAEAEIHIVPGPSAGACLQEGLGLAPKALLIDHDCLSCGPLQSLESLEDWRRVRQDYLRSIITRIRRLRSKIRNEIC